MKDGHQSRCAVSLQSSRDEAHTRVSLHTRGQAPIPPSNRLAEPNSHENPPYRRTRSVASISLYCLGEVQRAAPHSPTLAVIRNCICVTVSEARERMRGTCPLLHSFMWEQKALLDCLFQNLRQWHLPSPWLYSFMWRQTAFLKCLFQNLRRWHLASPWLHSLMWGQPALLDCLLQKWHFPSPWSHTFRRA